MSFERLQEKCPWKNMRSYPSVSPSSSPSSSPNGGIVPNSSSSSGYNWSWPLPPNNKKGGPYIGETRVFEEVAVCKVLQGKESDSFVSFPGGAPSSSTFCKKENCALYLMLRIMLGVEA